MTRKECAHDAAETVVSTEDFETVCYMRDPDEPRFTGGSKQLGTFETAKVFRIENSPAPSVARLRSSCARALAHSCTLVRVHSCACDHVH